MTGPANPPARARLRLTPIGGLVVGAYFGAMVPAMIIGVLIGAEQAGGAFGRLLILVAELADLFGGQSILAMRILPWAAVAAGLGGWVGRRWAKAAADR